MPLSGLNYGAVPSLDDVAREPQKLEGLDIAMLAALALRASAVTGAIAARLALNAANGTVAAPATDGGDRLLDVHEAAAKTGLTPNALYRRKDLPFKVRTGQHQVRFSAAGIDRWIRAKTTLRECLQACNT